MKLYEILVPTIHSVTKKPIHTRFHRVWDTNVRDLTGGLTIMPASVNGHWLSPQGECFTERMIPVRICTTEETMNTIAKMTKEYYNQEAVMYYVISTDVIIK